MPKKGQVLKKTGSTAALASTAQISASLSDSEASRARTARENNGNNASGDGAVLVSHADVVELKATAADTAVFENFTCSSDVPASTPKGRPKPVYCSELAGHPFAVQDLNGDGNCSHYEVDDARSPAKLPMDSDAPIIEEKQMMALKVVKRLMNGALVSAFERWRDALPGTEDPTFDHLVTALESPVSDEGTIPDSFQKSTVPPEHHTKIGSRRQSIHGDTDGKQDTLDELLQPAGSHTADAKPKFRNVARNLASTLLPTVHDIRHSSDANTHQTSEVHIRGMQKSTSLAQSRRMSFFGMGTSSVFDAHRTSEMHEMQQTRFSSASVFRSVRTLDRIGSLAFSIHGTTMLNDKESTQPSKKRSILKHVSVHPRDGINLQDKSLLVGIDRRKTIVAEVRPDIKRRVRFFIPSSTEGTVRNLFIVWDPDGLIVSRWKLVMMMPLVYEVWAGPFRLALGTPFDAMLRIMDVASDLFFVLDSFVSCNTAIKLNQDGEGMGKNEGYLERSRAEILRHYFQNSFPVMILPAIVYLAITFSTKPTENDYEQDQMGNLGLWWLVSLPRLFFRARRLFKYFQTMNMNLEVSVKGLQALKLILMIVLTSHSIGSFWFFLARVQPKGSPIWFQDLKHYFPAYKNGFQWHPSLLLENYLLCMYRGLDGLVGLGYFPIVPTNTSEMIFSITVQLIGIYVSAYILGSLFHYLLVSQKDPLREAQSKKMKELEDFMAERRLPLATRKKLLDYFQFQYKKAVQRKASAALKLPQSLEVKVANARFRPTLQKCCNKGSGKERGSFFGCSVQFLNTMVTKLRPVFLMPGDQFIRASDMVLELCFVSSGYAEVMDGDVVKRIIRSDIDAPSIVGEVSFFLGVQQQHSVRAPTSSDIELLVLNKEAADDLFRDYPEQQEIITTNILTKYNMDSKGDDLENEAMEDDEDTDALALRIIIKDTVKRRHDEAFQALAWAVTSGDLEEVRRMLRKGVGINTSNYDGKTVLHMAAAEGNYRVVELLLGEKADKNAKDRWGNTALQDAINNNQGPVVQLLAHWKSELNAANAAGRLCDAASAGDLDTLKLILEHGVDPNIGDYDARTPLHLASAEGQDKAVQYLISKGADVNFKDRWGATPLQDAVQSGHLQVAEQILSRGGVMTTSMGPIAMCNAANEGDVRYLKLLIRCGVNPDIGDYDSRCPMHLAASEGRLLAVSYLLGVSANPNCKDRWGGTPMDDCVRGGTVRHLQCAKLLQCLGGVMGSTSSSELYREAKKNIDQTSMEDVRKVIKLLIDQGLDTKKPNRATQQQCVIALEATFLLMPAAKEIEQCFSVSTKLMRQMHERCKQFIDLACSSCVNIARFVDTVINVTEDAKAEETNKGVIEYHSMEDDAREFHSVIQAGEDAEALDRFFHFEIDAQTMQRYQELDDLLSMLELEKYSSRAVRIDLAKDFNRALMNLCKVEEMWRVLNDGFDEFFAGCPEDIYGLEVDALAQALDYFDLHFSFEETRQIFNEATDGVEVKLATAENVLCGSINFHSRLLQHESDDNAQLFMRSEFLCQLTWKRIQLISAFAKRISVGDGEIIRLKERSVVAVLSGSLVVKYEIDGFTETVDIGRDDVVGESWCIFDVAKIASIESTGCSVVVLVSWREFAFLFELDPSLHLTFASAFMDTARNNNATTKMKPFEAESLKKMGIAKNDKHGASRQKHAKAPRTTGLETNIDEFKEFLSKSDDRRERDFAVVKAMEYSRESCRFEWSGSFRKVVFIAFILWKLKVSWRTRNDVETPANLRRTVLRQGFQVIDDTWNIVSGGTKSIFFSQLQGIKENLGEVGTFFFESAFPESKMQEVLEFEDWVTCWLRYVDNAEDEDDSNGGNGDGLSDTGSQLSARSAKSAASEVSTMSHTSFASKKSSTSRKSRRNKIRVHNGDSDAANEIPQFADGDGDGWFHSHNWFAKLAFQVYYWLYHHPITPLLQDREMASAFKLCYIRTVGDLKANLERSKVLEYLELLLIDFGHKFSEMHVGEFMEIFCPEGKSGVSMTWPDIERGHRELGLKVLRPDRFFIEGRGSPLNPKSPFLRTFYSLNQMIAVYYFFHVPVRICFNPYHSMFSWQYLPVSLDLFADVFVLVFILINFNTSYLNKKTKWVSDRNKIARHYLSTQFLTDLLCVVPMDWLSSLSGANHRVSATLRLPKMLFVLSAFHERNEGLTIWRNMGSERIMCILILCTMHVLSCILFLLGKDAPEDVFSWYKAPSASANYDYSGLRHGREEFNLGYKGFGGIEDENGDPRYDTWRQYLLSFYWTTTTVTTTGVVGDMLPKNYWEVAYTCIYMLLNLTILNIAIGQVSTSVLKGDENLMKAREELGAVESYLNSYDFADDLKIEIKRYFQGAAANASISAAEIFDSVSQSLRFEMSSELTRKCLDNCTLFAGCSKQMKDAIKGLLREVHFSSEEFLVQINTVAHDMFFIMSGKVEQLTNDSDGQQMVEYRIGRGGSVGVLAAYFGIRYLNSVRATSLGGPCLCLRLVRNHLMPVLKAYPEDEEIVAQNAMSDFQKVKIDKSVAGGSVRGRSVKSGARSVQSNHRQDKRLLAEKDNASDDEGSEQSMKTAYQEETEEEKENDVDAIITSGIEQKLADLNQRRKVERISQFCSAASRGQIQKLKRALRNGVHIDETDTNGRTALHCAASEGRLECVRFLLESSASLNIQDKYKNTPRNDAVRHQHDTVAAELRRYGAASVQLPGYEMGVLMCTFGFEGDKVQLERMLANGVDVNISDYDKRTALHLASSQGHLQVVEYLLERQADVNSTDRLGFSPLVDALRHDRSEVQKLLRSKGGQLLGMEVSVELCNAAAVGDVPRMKALIENGANPNAGDYDSRTALHLAASNGETSALDYILRCIENINVNPLDRLGGTPLDDANRHGHAVAVAMLEAAGGLRHDDPSLQAIADKVHAESELLQRSERSGKVKDLVSASSETKACAWIKGRCGKLLPGHLNELRTLDMELQEDLSELQQAIDEFLKYWEKRLESKRGIQYSAEQAVKSPQYRQVVEYARNIVDAMARWRNTAQAVSGVISEEMPRIRVVNMFSKTYKHEMKRLLDVFNFMTKVLQYLRFLLHKIPEVQAGTAAQERKDHEHNKENGASEEDYDNLAEKMSSKIMRLHSS